jgi:hypothetical protein
MIYLITREEGGMFEFYTDRPSWEAALRIVPTPFAFGKWIGKETHLYDRTLNEVRVKNVGMTWQESVANDLKQLAKGLVPKQTNLGMATMADQVSQAQRNAAQTQYTNPFASQARNSK